MTYDDARSGMAERLERHAMASPDHPHEGYDEFDGALPRNVGAEWYKIFIALHFWDGWIDASNHAWAHYEPIARSDWPQLARELASNLRADRDITNPVVLKHFDFRSKARN